MLSREVGGSPGTSFLSKIESGAITPSSATCVKLADALAIPRDVLLNASGLATPEQVERAMDNLKDVIGEPAPVVVYLPVVDPKRPDVPLESLPRRARMMRDDKTPAFLVDLGGEANLPFVGEVLVMKGRRPRDGQGVVAIVNGEAGAWTFHASRQGDYLENGKHERRDSGYTTLGTIARVVSEIDLAE